MNILYELSHGIGFYGIILLITGAMTACLTFYGLRFIRSNRLRDLQRDEQGAAYSLSFVLVFPFYIFLIAIFLEMIFLYHAKLGTLLAAYSAARSAAVHNTTSEVSDDAIKYGKRSAVYSMVPFACGFKDTESSTEDCTNFWKAVDDYRSDDKLPFAESYRKKKFGYAEQAMEVKIELADGESGKPWTQDVVVTIEYEFPFMLPYFGKILGGTKGRYSESIVKIISTAAIQNECSQNEKGLPGIDYPPKNE